MLTCTHTHTQIIFHHLPPHAFDSSHARLLFELVPHLIDHIGASSKCLLVISARRSVWQSLVGLGYLPSCGWTWRQLLAHCNTESWPVSHSSIDLQKHPILCWANARCVSLSSLSTYTLNFSSDLSLTLFSHCRVSIWLLTRLVLCVPSLFQVPLDLSAALEEGLPAGACVFESPRATMFVWVPLHVCTPRSESVCVPWGARQRCRDVVRCGSCCCAAVCVRQPATRSERPWTWMWLHASPCWTAVSKTSSTRDGGGASEISRFLNSLWCNTFQTVKFQQFLSLEGSKFDTVFLQLKMTRNSIINAGFTFRPAVTSLNN